MGSLKKVFLQFNQGDDIIKSDLTWLIWYLQINLNKLTAAANSAADQVFDFEVFVNLNLMLIKQILFNKDLAPKLKENILNLACIFNCEKRLLLLHQMKTNLNNLFL